MPQFNLLVITYYYLCSYDLYYPTLIPKLFTDYR